MVQVLCVLPKQSAAAAKLAINSVLGTERGHFAYGVAPLAAAPDDMQQVGVWVQLAGGKVQQVISGSGFSANEVR